MEANMGGKKISEEDVFSNNVIRVVMPHPVNALLEVSGKLTMFYLIACSPE